MRNEVAELATCGERVRPHGGKINFIGRKVIKTRFTKNLKGLIDGLSNLGQNDTLK